MAKRGTRDRIALLTVFLLPLSIFIFLYVGSRQEFDRVPYQRYLTADGDSATYTLPEFSFTNLQGETVTRSDLLGNILLIDFFSAVDDPFKRTTVLHGNLKRIYDNVEWEREPGIRIVSINTGDSLATVTDYAKSLEVDSTFWIVLTGDRQEVLDLGKEAFKIPRLQQMNDTTPPLTAQTVALIDKEGKVRKFYVATDLVEERRIQEDLITLMRLEYPEELERVKENK